MKQIPLTQGYFTVVDDDTFEYLSRFKWCLNMSRGKAYAASSSSGRRVLMHRLITGAIPGQFVDHINGDGLLNTRENLRFATLSQNQMNRKPNSTSKCKHKGVSPVGNKFLATIKICKKSHKIGIFHTEAEAAQAYNNAALQHFGEFARLNEM